MTAMIRLLLMCIMLQTLVFGSGACSAPGPEWSTASGAGAATSSMSASSSATTGGGVPAEPIQIGPTSGTLTRPFTFSVIGSGATSVGEVNVQNGVGTMVIGGSTLPVVVYEKQPFEDYFLYQSLAVASDRLYVVWFYCLLGQLEGIYIEGTDGTPLTVEAGSGGCAEMTGENTASVAFPALNMSYPPPLQGYAIEGADISLPSGAPGVAHIQGATYAVAAFSEVDCTQCDDFGGWFEVHALLWDGERVCFAIFYLVEGEPVLVTYVLCLPDLSDPIGSTLLDATFEH